MECCGVFGVSLTVINKNLKDYGIKKDNNSRRKNIEKTFVKKYGSKSCFGSDKVRNKCKETMLKKYGVSYTAQSVDLQKKMQNTMNERYGKKNYVGVKYGVTWPCQIDKCVKALEDAVGHSKPEQMFEKILKDNDIKFEREFPIRGFKYDFKVGNILFEINPTGTHNVNFGLFGKPAKNKMYHYTKYSVAKENGYRCINIWDWDDWNKVARLFAVPKEKIYARKCEIKLVDKKETKEFINLYHLQGYANDNIRIGLYYNNELVEIMTFDKPRYNKNYEYELIRLCGSKNVIGGAEKLYKYFINKYNVGSVISYCDLSKFDGEVYKKLGFIVKGKPEVSAHWYNVKTGKHITDNLLRKKGFDQLFKANFGKGTNNEELMKEHGFLKVYDCGQLVFVDIIK